MPAREGQLQRWKSRRKVPLLEEIPAISTEPLQQPSSVKKTAKECNTIPTSNLTKVFLSNHSEREGPATTLEESTEEFSDILTQEDTLALSTDQLQPSSSEQITVDWSRKQQSGLTQDLHAVPMEEASALKPDFSSHQPSRQEIIPESIQLANPIEGASSTIIQEEAPAAISSF